MFRVLFLIVPFLLLVHVTSASALPPCPSDDDAYWDNCEGSYTWTSGPHSGDKYVGGWRDDKKHGHGTYYYLADNEFKGDTYVGEYRDDKRHGYGTYTWADGDKYAGEFRDGKAHGYGTYTYASGDKYVGEHRDDKAHGHGTYTYASGDKYVGEYRDDKKHGHGTYTFADGDKYVGEWRDDKYHGHGTYYYLADNEFKGDTYVGEYRVSKAHGHGTYTMSDEKTGTLYGRNLAGLETVGEFVNDYPNGNVTLYWSNGDVWVGRVRTSREDGIKWLGGNKYTAGNVPPEVYAGRDGGVPAISTSMDKAKSQCEELGFLPKTEKYGDCVLKLLEMN